MALKCAINENPQFLSDQPQTGRILLIHQIAILTKFYGFGQELWIFH